ncbi:hypothetical protein BJ944DRAFT_273876 [Cunninghamella echinulata]|nr:hypothetical protein BJ944DRAFT_273876 [Cunninghamella echinulata]
MKTILYSTFYYLLLLLIINIIKPSYQQNTTATTPTDDNNDDDDSCAFISGQNCDNNGVCKACVMCLQSSCILSKSIHSLKAPSNTPVCNTTLFGDTDIYNWYGYCLSSGLDNSGDNCTASTQCYPYQRNNISTSFIWQSLTCEPNSCSLITDNGQPPPLPTALPSPNDDNNSNNGNGNGNGSGDTAGDANNSIHDNRYRHRMENRAITIALSVTCTLIFVATMAWLFRRWKKLQYWPMSFKKKQAPSSSSPSSPNLPEGVSSSLPTTAPPSFRSTVSSSSRRPEMRQRRHSTPSLISTSSIERTDPLPSYFSPDPSLPKYEQAIVTQIRGLLFDDRHYHAIASSSSSSSNTSLPTTTDHAQQQQYMDDETNMMMDHHTNALPPPMWVPVYFTPNHSFSVGRMRRHPQYYPFHHAHPPSALSGSNNNEQDLGTSHHEHSS